MIHTEFWYAGEEHKLKTKQKMVVSIASSSKNWAFHIERKRCLHQGFYNKFSRFSKEAIVMNIQKRLYLSM